MRHELLVEALHIIRGLFSGDYFNFAGDHFRVDSAKLWDVSDEPPRIGLAVSGRRGKPRVGQVPICWDLSRDAAIERAHDQFRWFGGGWKVNLELPGPSAFAGASQFVRPEDVAESIPCGPDVEAHVGAVREFVKAGFTDVAVVQVGGDSQPEFLDWAERELVPALREL